MFNICTHFLMNTMSNQHYKCALKQRGEIFIFKSYAHKLYQLALFYIHYFISVDSFTFTLPDHINH